MISILAQATSEPLMLMSIVKPLIMLVVLGGWAWVISHLDKDLQFYYLPRLTWNGVQMACGVVAFGLWMMLPMFWLGLPIALLVLAGGIVGYAVYRNSQVPEKARWSLSIDSFRHKVEQMQHASAQRHATLVLLTKDDGKLPVPAGEDPMVRAHEALEAVLDFAIPRGADRVDLLVDAKQAAMSVRIDGVRYPQTAPEPVVALSLIDYVKAASGLDIADRRRKQTGLMRLEVGEHGKHQVEVTTLGSTRGLTCTFAIDPVKRGSVPLEELGLVESQRQAIKQLVDRKGHVVIVAAKAHHGQTTTLYSLAREHDPYTQGIVAYETSPAFDLEGVSRHPRPATADAKTVNDALAAILRQDPDVVMLDNLADAQTAVMCAKNAEDVRFYFGMPQEDTFSALKVWMKAVGDARLAGTALGGILAQRLVRKLCTVCRVSYTPDKDALRKLNLPADRVGQLYKSSGQVRVGKDKVKPCPACHGIGYRGRTAVFEVMALDDHARRLIASNELDQLRAHLRKQKMLWLQEAALARVVEGVTDVKEVARVMGDGNGSAD